MVRARWFDTIERSLYNALGNPSRVCFLVQHLLCEDLFPGQAVSNKGCFAFFFSPGSNMAYSVTEERQAFNL
jgi:hypothetical protein